jgi:hypothetical protein
VRRDDPPSTEAPHDGPPSHCRTEIRPRRRHTAAPSLIPVGDVRHRDQVDDARDLALGSWCGTDTARDGAGAQWKGCEDRSPGPKGETRQRLPAHRALRFDWYAASPDTGLVK